MYLVYFNGPEYYKEYYFTSLSKAKDCFESMKNQPSDYDLDELYDPEEVTLMLIEIHNDGIIYSDTHGEICIEGDISILDNWNSN